MEFKKMTYLGKLGKWQVNPAFPFVLSFGSAGVVLNNYYVSIINNLVMETSIHTVGYYKVYF